MTTIDPICHMTVDTATAAGSATVKGETYYFCSQACEVEFRQEAGKAEPAACCSSTCCGN